MTDEEPALKERIFKLVERNHGTTSFAEFMNGGFSEHTDGDFAIYAPNRPNTIIWPNLSSEFVKAVCALLDEKRIHFRPTTTLVYLHDGQFLRIPVVKKIGKVDFKKPHWLPVVINLGPHPDEGKP